jgi:hypothetical protein
LARGWVQALGWLLGIAPQTKNPPLTRPQTHHHNPSKRQ